MWLNFHFLMVYLPLILNKGFVLHLFGHGCNLEAIHNKKH